MAWEYTGKNIYIKKYKGSIKLKKVTDRIEELGGNIVSLNTKEKIDVCMYVDEEELHQNAKGLEDLMLKYSKKGLAPIVLVKRDSFLKSMGFSPLKQFEMWEEYPNYNPFTGEKLEIWDESKVEQGESEQIAQEMALDLEF